MELEEFDNVIHNFQVPEVNDHDEESNITGNFDDAGSGESSDENDELVEDCFLRDDELSSTVIESPGGTSYWIPNVDDGMKPNNDWIFDNFKKAILKYISYAKQAGFDARRGSSKKENNIVTRKYVLCSKEGKPNKSKVDTIEGEMGKRKRKRSSKRTSCPAKISFITVVETGQIIVHSFEERHNHPLFNRDTMHMSRHRRQLNFFDKSVIHNLSTINVGASKAHDVVSVINGGHDMPGPHTVDFKNWQRDLNSYIEDSDANMLVNRMKSRQENEENFSFEYACGEDHLTSLFWTDAIAKRNYSEFSDVVSFDATFRTNKYRMIFVPFTGIDNHKRCVTFGAGLLSNEQSDSYIWLLKCFVKCLGKQPKIVVTDQDPAMAKAISNVFTESTHRLCMWHIVKKIGPMVIDKRLAETDFRKRIQALIWNTCNDPILFESRWEDLVKKYNIEDNKWLQDMFAIRERWIPAYFKDIPLSGLMRTTSRSESENHFFQTILSRKSNLLAFMSKYDTAMDKQRKKQSISDYKSNNTLPILGTPLQIEVDASKFYTQNIFWVVQNEIHDSCWRCSSSIVSVFGERCVYNVVEQRYSKAGRNRSFFVRKQLHTDGSDSVREHHFKVTVNNNEDTYKCSCMLFEHQGMLCRHVFSVMQAKFKDHIPEKYMLRRWRKDIIRVEELRRKYTYRDGSNECEKMINYMYSIIAESVSLISHDRELIKKFIEIQKDARDALSENHVTQDTRSKHQQIEALVGISKDCATLIHNPEGIKNKGSSSGKRLKSQAEIASTSHMRDWRTCTWCKKKVDPREKHDRRSCPERKEKEGKKNKSGLDG